MDYHFARWILPVNRPPIENGFIAVENGHIQAIGRREELAPSLCMDWDASDTSLVTPGLVNTHTHLDQSFKQPIPPEGTMAEWLARVVETNRAAATLPERLARCRDGVEELLASGTTCVNDISTDGSSVFPLAEAGLRGIVSLELIHPANSAPQLDALQARFETLQRACTAQLQAGWSPHSPYNVSPTAWQALLSAFPKAPIHTHLAESTEESAFFAGQPSQIDELHRRFLGQAFPPVVAGLSPVAYLQHFGLLNARTIAAHGVYTSATDRALLAEVGVTLAHCPRSNRFLHHHTLNWSDWQDCGVPIGLGTDGHLSTETLDLREEARIAMALHGFGATQALRMMTLDGATALHLQQELGSLEPNKAADWVRWQPNDASIHQPPETQLFAATTHLLESRIAGERIYQGGFVA